MNWQPKSDGTYTTKLRRGKQFFEASISENKDTGTYKLSAEPGGLKWEVRAEADTVALREADLILDGYGFRDA